MKAFILTVLLSLPTFAAELETVKYIEPQRYLGDWYSIARNPLPFEGDCYCARQRLTLRQDGDIDVYNSCRQGAVDGPLAEIRGIARNEDPTSNSKFSVDFGLPRLGQYWIIGIDKHYRFAVVSDPDRASLYILSKTPNMKENLYRKALRLAAAKTDISKLKKTNHKNCVYP